MKFEVGLAMSTRSVRRVDIGSLGRVYIYQLAGQMEMKYVKFG